MHEPLLSRKAALIALAAFLVLALVQNAWYWSQLPDRVAIHFGPNGQPNNWMNRFGATLLMLALQIGMPLFLYGIAWSIKLFPPSLVNIPHREYWLHPDRREQTLETANRTMSWVAVAVAAFTMAINHLTFVANRNGEGLQMTWFTILLVGFLAIVFALVGQMAWSFRLPKAYSSGSM
jgi:uncharacterized membrane protein